jgi:hypothetical protein
VEKQDDAKIQDVLERLEKEAHAMAAKLYESAGPAGGAAPGGEGPKASGAEPGGKKSGDVIDAEFEDAN